MTDKNEAPAGVVERLRDEAAVDCFEIRQSGDKLPAKVTEYVDTQRVARFGANGDQVEHVVAVIAVRPGYSKPTRREHRLSKLMPDTPEALAAWEEYLAASKTALEANKAAGAAFDKIPRLSVDDVAELRRIKQGEGAGQ